MYDGERATGGVEESGSEEGGPSHFVVSVFPFWWEFREQEIGFPNLGARRRMALPTITDRKWDNWSYVKIPSSFHNPCGWTDTFDHIHPLGRQPFTSLV